MVFKDVHVDLLVVEGVVVTQDDGGALPDGHNSLGWRTTNLLPDCGTQDDQHGNEEED